MTGDKDDHSPHKEKRKTDKGGQQQDESTVHDAVAEVKPHPQS